ncbi:tripartite tricarboxylate transporter TctB family protein [Defluviimonas sp. WL0002]|uniref:Tripartite tricarboxylate transporter TctB family protein n=1 Tax=Albidovulum marisflavi TaxID=2984159 RepID=A0ABT2ZE22_9RHOB|nr:tripartite tricarboxylate transporter TctB family protein [Defluviimonas sp. WL0002]MCV2869272.1 tripartite tricarboxylate transporter TctB family protein [Defluviimonas sp. WL0002]
MSRIKTLQDLFRRYRRPGDFVIAFLSFAFALFLAACLPFQITWVEGTALFAQPAFWPSVAIALMLVFSTLHMIGALVSERIPGRLAEVVQWIKAIEYGLWFMAYVFLVPVLGYLPATILFTVSLTFRLGYRGWKWSVMAALFAVVVVVLFKTFLHVKIPAGAAYDLLPAGSIRSFLLTYL